MLLVVVRGTKVGTADDDPNDCSHELCLVLLVVVRGMELDTAEDDSDHCSHELCPV